MSECKVKATVETVTLTLSSFEASVLLRVCGRVVGNSQARRVFSDRTDSIKELLLQAGVEEYAGSIRGDISL